MSTLYLPAWSIGPVSYTHLDVYKRQGTVRRYRHLQGAACALENGFKDVMGVFSGKLPEVEGAGAGTDKGQEKLLGKFCVKGPHLGTGQVHGPAQVIPAAEIAGAQHQGLIHGQQELTVAGDTSCV